MRPAYRIVRENPQDTPPWWLGGARKMFYCTFDLKWYWVEDSLSGTCHGGEINRDAALLEDALELAQLDDASAYIEEVY